VCYLTCHLKNEHNYQCNKHKQLKNGEFPLWLRVTKDRQRKYISLNVSVMPNHWDFIKQQPKPNCPNKEYLDKLIFNKISAFREKVIELKSEEKEFSAKSLIDKIITTTRVSTVGELFKDYISELKNANRTGYALSVEQVYNSLFTFNNHLDIYFSEIDVDWLKNYEQWLRQQKIVTNTIGIRFRTLRAIYNLAINKGFVKTESYPFKKFKVAKFNQKTAKRAITKNEILSIINYKNSCNFYTSFAVDLFTFSYFMGGINFTDIAYLTNVNLVADKLIYTRKKTSKLISLPLNKKALAIISRYSNNSNHYLFPILSEFHQTEQQKRNRIHKAITKVNKALDEVGKELKIPIKLTTYVARDDNRLLECKVERQSKTHYRIHS